MLHIKVNNNEFIFEPKSGEVLINGKPVNADVVKLAKNKFHILLNHISYHVELSDKDESGKNMLLYVNGVKQTVQIKEKYDDLLKQLGIDKLKNKKSNAVKAPMPGMVLRILTEPGAVVKKGDTMLVLEAMKMEHVLQAPRDGVIAAVAAEEGAQIKEGAVLVRLEPLG